MSRSENTGAIRLVSDSEDTDDEFNPHNIFREDLESDGASDDFTFIQDKVVEFRGYLDRLQSERPLGLESNELFALETRPAVTNDEIREPDELTQDETTSERNEEPSEESELDKYKLRVADLEKELARLRDSAREGGNSIPEPSSEEVFSTFI